MAGYTASSSNLDWLTPDWIISKVRVALGGKICLDPCSSQWSRVNAEVEYVLPQNDGLKDSWDFKTIFINPPFGRCHVHRVTKEYLSAKAYKDLPEELRVQYTSTKLSDWVKRAAEAHSVHGSEVILLLPAAVETKHWQETIFETATGVCFPNGRVAFDEPEAQVSERKKKLAPPMGSALVYWGNDLGLFRKTFDRCGTIIALKNSVYSRVCDKY